MFSGIVESTAVVQSLDGDGRFSLRSELFSRAAAELKIGDSVSVSGVCLTLVARNGDLAEFDLASETLRRTTLGGLRPGAEVNLERSLRFGASVDGHLVQGHVDAVAEVIRCEAEERTIRLTVTRPEEVRELIVPKGAIALEGVSLTVGEVLEESFTVYLIPHTKSVTTLNSVQPGRLLNVEADCIARYVASFARAYLDANGFGLKADRR